jgi:hypothetical protein
VTHLRRAAVSGITTSRGKFAPPPYLFANAIPYWRRGINAATDLARQYDP